MSPVSARLGLYDSCLRAVAALKVVHQALTEPIITSIEMSSYTLAVMRKSLPRHPAAPSPEAVPITVNDTIPSYWVRTGYSDGTVKNVFLLEEPPGVAFATPEREEG